MSGEVNSLNGTNAREQERKGDSERNTKRLVARPFHQHQHSESRPPRGIRIIIAWLSNLGGVFENKSSAEQLWRMHFEFQGSRTSLRVLCYLRI